MRSAARSTSSTSPSSYRTACFPFFALNAWTVPGKNAPSAGQKTRTRRSIAASPGSSFATCAQTALGKKSRILGFAARLDLRTPSSVVVPPAEPGVVSPEPGDAPGVPRAEPPAARADAAGAASRPSAPAMRRRSHWLLLLVVALRNATRNVSCSSFWPIARSSRMRPSSSVEEKHDAHAARVRASSSVSSRTRLASSFSVAAPAFFSSSRVPADGAGPAPGADSLLARLPGSSCT
mmetsp:Transcript_8256/g.34524  ORF Transcript_8256/g.34524 Transcript_8256/m.34524 type:complete len:236 (-) Transcript_8256:673-1380(-)